MPDLDALIAKERWGWSMGKKRHLLGRVVRFGAGQSYIARCRSFYCPLYLDPVEETPNLEECCAHCLRLLRKEAPKCPRCGEPDSGLFSGSSCDSCGWKNWNPEPDDG